MSSTRQRILETLCQRGPLPVEEIARHARLSKMATRYHLGLLAQERLVLRLDAELRGRVGRPQGLFALADHAFARLPQPYERVIECLLGELENGLGRKAACALAQRTGKRIAEMAPILHLGAGTQARLNRAVSFLAQLGYAAAGEKEGDLMKLTVRHCPYHQMADCRPRVCEMDGAMMGALLGNSFVMTDSIARGANHCQFVIHSRN